MRYVATARLGTPAPRMIIRRSKRGLGDGCDDGSIYCLWRNSSTADLLINSATGKITPDQQTGIIQQCQQDVATAGGDTTQQARCRTDITAAVKQAGGVASLPFSSLPSLDLSNLPFWLMLGGVGFLGVLIATR